MKLTHISLCGPVTDFWSYQDNLLPKFHKQLGYEVSMITSKYIWDSKGSIVVDNRDVYINEHGIKTIRINNTWRTNINSKLKKYEDICSVLEIENPDVLFIHGIQFLDIKEIVKYIKLHPDLVVYVDNHADFSNSATNWLSKNILHKLIWRYTANIIEPYAKKFYGVLPARVNFLNEMYNIPQNKLELLVMGIDDDQLKNLNENFSRDKFRKKYNIEPDDFLIVTGGKIDSSKKQTLNLMKAVQKVESSKIKLIVFGSVSDELKEKVEQMSDGTKVQYIGWINPNECNKYFYSADIAVFPGRHSVFWEQVVGLGVPIIVKYWKGTNHIDVGGNCKFLYENNIDEIQIKIEELYNDKEKYNRMLEIARKNGPKKFLYSNIAKESLS